MSAYRSLTAAAVPTRTAARLAGVARATATRKPRTLPIPTAAPVPANKLDAAERARILAVVNSARFVDLPPVQIYAALLDEGTYLASISTIYRVLAENKQVKERRRLARHPARAIPELVATGPGQVYSWDITKLPGPIKGKYFDCYVMIDIYSHYIVGAHVHASESGELSVEMMKEIFANPRDPEVVHAERGQRVHGHLRRGLQPRPPPLRDRTQHRGRHSLWVGCGQTVQRSATLAAARTPETSNASPPQPTRRSSPCPARPGSSRHS
jgi:putative transposase